MDDRVMQKTQDTLGKIIKKPPLTEKLLKKPPFRFLHDIMTSVIKTTGFMKGLYTDLELQSDNVKDKDSKIAFLQKAIDIVSLATGQSLSVKPSKIVAGHEPEKTNEFLQALAAAVGKKSKNEALVQQVLKGETSSTKKEKERDTSSDRREKSSKREKDRDSEKKPKETRESKDSDKSKDKEQDKENRDESRKRRSEKRESIDGGRSSEKDKNKTGEDKPPKAEKSSRENVQVAQDADNQDESGDDDDADGQAAKIPRPASAKGSRRRQPRDEKNRDDSKDRDEGEKPVEDERPVAAQRRSARPSSARPAPPKPKKQQETVPEPEIRIGSGKRVTQVIVDDAQNSDDDDNFMVEESAPPEPLLPQKLDQDDENDEVDHGGLVKKILETKKELEGGSQQQLTKKVEIEKPAMSDVTRRKEREMVQKEIDILRQSIQTLTRSANPLGKIMDYVQEDLDSMQKELEKWKQENKEHAQALKREQGVTETSIEPLKGQLTELDESISSQLVLIAASKANILRNDSKINKMLGSVTKS